MSGFGFDVPQGDPGALEAAASNWRNLATALASQGEGVGAASQVALGAGGWQGPASGAFAHNAERLLAMIRSDVEACGEAASGLSQLARALEQAQRVTRQALSDCSQSQNELTTQQGIADRAGQDAQTAEQAAATAVHPHVANAYSQDASRARSAQTTAQQAAGRAQGDLTAAQTRAQQAVTAYEHEAQTAVSQLRSAAEDMRPSDDVADGWADPIVSWAGHVNDFAGAGAAGLIKGYDAAIGLATGRLVAQTYTVLGDPTDVSNVLSGQEVLPFDAEPDPTFDMAAGAQRFANSPLTKVLTKGLPEDTFSVLGKVPALAAGITAVDMILNRNEGVGKAVVEPVGNLVAGTVITETVGSSVAGGVASAASSLALGDGTIAALAGTAIVPGVGEVVAVGIVAVGGTILVDKAASEIWDHRAAIGHGLETAGDWVYDQGKSAVDTAKGAGSWALHEGGSLVHDGSSLLHDAEPWHWSL